MYDQSRLDRIEAKYLSSHYYPDDREAKQREQMHALRVSQAKYMQSFRWARRAKHPEME